MKTLKTMLSVSVAALAIAVSVPVLAQDAKTASFHGHVTSPAGVPQPNGEVTFTQDRTVEVKSQKILNRATIGPDGNYSVTGVTPGDYFVYVMQGENHVDRADITVKAGEDRTLDFDMSRKDYLDKLSPEERKQIEDYKKSISEATKANAAIANLNATLQAVRADLKTPTPNFDKDMADMKAATDAKPDEGILWMAYGDALLASADNMAATDKKNGKQLASDDEALKRYADAIDAYGKGADLNAKSKKPSPADQAVAYNLQAQVYMKTGKVQEGQATYDKAATLNPPSAAMFYGNAAAQLYNLGQTNPEMNKAALVAADKAIAAAPEDPKRADAYYIKGQILLQSATLDSKTQKLVAPAGCVDAYQHYLALAPEGRYAPDVKAVLAELGEKISTHYVAPKK